MKKLMLLLMAGMAVAMFAVAQPTSAQKALFANVSADAQCTVTGSDLMVDAGLIQKDAPSSGPFVSTVAFFLEQHFPNDYKWYRTNASEVMGSVNEQLDLLYAGERYDVSTHDYQNICTLVDPGANAVRAVVQITVSNANTKRPGQNVFTGRCISIANPCGR